jgi:hypothetical protein
MLDRRSDLSGSSSKSELIHIDITHKSSFFSRYINRRDMARGRGDRHWSYPLSIHTYWVCSFRRPYPCESSSVACLRERIPRKDIHQDDLSSHNTCIRCMVMTTASVNLIHECHLFLPGTSWGIPCEICSGSRRISRIRWSVAIVGDRCVSFLPRLIWTLQCRYIKIRHARKKPTPKVASSRAIFLRSPSFLPHAHRDLCCM